MSIQSEITLLQNTKGEIRNAIMEKGVTVTSSDLFSTYPTRISQISMTPGDKDALFRSLIERTATSLVIPEGTEVIRYGAFNHYETLTSVTIPNTVTTICHGAFGGTKGITSIVIPNSVTTIEETAFSGSGLTSVTLPSSVTSIEGYTFSNCTSLASVTIPNSVTIIKQYAFENCTSLTSVNIPDSVASINRYAFTGCSNLASITFNSTTPPSLASHALDNTNNCPIYVPEESVDAYKTAWSDYASRIQAIPVESFAMKFTPAGGGTPIEVELEDLATAGTIESTDVPSTIKNRTGTLEIGEGVTTIGTLAFYSFTKLTSVSIPNSVTNIGNGAFEGCTSLDYVTVNATTPPTLGNRNNSFDNTNDCLIIVPVSSVDTYKTAWSEYAYRIQAIRVPAMKWVSPDGTYEISIACEDLATAGTLAQSDRTAADPGNLMGSGEGSAEIGDCVTTIGQSAFYNCIGLTSITIPDSVTTIGQNAFLGCAGLTSVTIPNSVTSIGDNAFHGCTSLTSVTVNSTTPPTFGSGVFYSTNDCPIIVPVESVDAYKAASGWSTYADRIVGEGASYWKLISSECETDGSGKNTGYVTNTYEDANPSSSTYGNTRSETVQDEITCPITVVGTEFRRITSLDEATSGKYLIVKTTVNKALNASLIKDTTSTSTGINTANNMIDVTIEDDTITADATIMNAAADYDADNKTLSWTDSNTGTTYYLYWQGGSTARFAYNGITQPSTNYPMDATYYQSFNSFSFANSTKLLAYNTTSPRFFFYNPNSNVRYEANMALFKLN